MKNKKVILTQGEVDALLKAVDEGDQELKLLEWAVRERHQELLNAAYGSDSEIIEDPRKIDAINDPATFLGDRGLTSSNGEVFLWTIEYRSIEYYKFLLHQEPRLYLASARDLLPSKKEK